MKSTNRLLQALAILGAVASAYLYYSVETLGTAAQSELTETQSNLQFERSRVSNLSKTIAEQKTELDSNASALTKAKSEIISLNAKIGQLQRESQSLQDERDAQNTKEERLQSENGRISQALAELKANSVSKENIASLQSKIANLERELLETRQTTASSKNSPLVPNPLENPSLTGSILTVGKGASFVVLNIGHTHGVRLNHQFIIHHGGSAIAKIQVYEVKENLSIARVLPESLIKTPQQGDSVSSLN